MGLRIRMFSCHRVLLPVSKKRERNAITGTEQKQGPVIILGPSSITVMERYVSMDPITKKRRFLPLKATIRSGSSLYPSKRLRAIKKPRNQSLGIHLCIFAKG